MHRTSFPSGQVASALVTALMLHLEEKKGSAAADVWLKGLRTSRDELEDETRLISVAALHEALVAFSKECGRAEIIEIWPELLAPENLGFWMRVMRGTTSPAQAFSRLDSSESEYGRTTKWETLVVDRGYWRGRVHVLHDPSLEQDGLLALMRAAEIRAVPALFGFGPARVTARAATATESSLVSQEYEARWVRARPARLATITGTIGAALGACAAFAHLGLGPTLGAAIVGALGGFTFGITYSRELSRRTELHAQRVRVHALERSLTIKEARERAASSSVDGTVVAGRYRMMQRLGSGASGVIYAARRLSDGFPVAVKLLRAASAHDAIASDRLRREAEALGLSWHPNVVEMIDQGHLPDGTSYLVMELLHGETLSTRLKRCKTLSEVEAFAMAIQISDALVAVHAAGVVHRDIKPSNLFFARGADGVERVKLIDFGIARVEWEETRITGIGAPVGTPGYMSPEQETGGVIDARSDLFALGATLFECLAGEPPPPTPSGLWLSSGTPVEGVPVGIALRIPASMQPVILRAMSPKPDDRFNDARALSIALREAQRKTSRALA